MSAGSRFPLNGRRETAFFVTQRTFFASGHGAAGGIGDRPNVWHGTCRYTGQGRRLIQWAAALGNESPTGNRFEITTTHP